MMRLRIQQFSQAAGKSSIQCGVLAARNSTAWNGSELFMSASDHFVVAGHLCVDLTPALTSGWPQPGGLLEAVSLGFSGGGAVANVGSALWRLGCRVRLAGLVGNDRLGEIAIQLLGPLGDQPGIRIAQGGAATSYSIVIAPLESDRAFVHCPGANAIFTSRDVRDEDLTGAEWFHFGYPPLMPAISADGGKELVSLFRRAMDRGLRTSLDLSSISGAAALTDWPTLLRNCARSVTVFAPSIEELRAALGQPSQAVGDISDVQALAKTLFAMGFAIVVIKVGTNGVYLATTESSEDLAAWRLGAEWRGRELMAPCFRANFVNAVGAGDCTVAGFIASVAAGCGPEQALTMAVAAGASSVEAADASSGVPRINKLRERISSGWERAESGAPGEGWVYVQHLGVWRRAGGGLR
jgi:sugar/nucleoside kinase (ribokinase family)